MRGLRSLVDVLLCSLGTSPPGSAAEARLACTLRRMQATRDAPGSVDLSRLRATLRGCCTQAYLLWRISYGVLVMACWLWRIRYGHAEGLLHAGILVMAY